MFNEVPEAGGQVQATSDMFEHESNGASSFYLISSAMFYLGSQAKSFSDKPFLLPWLFPQSLGTFSAVPLSFMPLRPFCFPLNQILILTQIDCPNTFLFEATNLNIKEFSKTSSLFPGSQTIGKRRRVFGVQLISQEVRKLEL